MPWMLPTDLIVKLMKLIDKHPRLVATLMAFLPFADPRMLSGARISDGGDTFFFSWLMAHHWGQWAGIGHASYSDAGIFAPFPGTLYFSESFFGAAILGWPFFALGMNALTVFHWVNLIGWCATAGAMVHFCQMQGLRPQNAMLATILFVFSGFHISHLFGHLQAAFAVFILLAMIGGQDWLKNGRTRGWWLMTFGWAASLFFNTYFFVFITYALPLWLLYLVWVSGFDRAKIARTFLLFGASLLAVIAMTIKTSLEYVQIRQMFPNILFSESSRTLMQLDFSSLFRSNINLILARRHNWNENSGYIGLGFFMIVMIYVTYTLRNQVGKSQVVSTSVISRPVALGFGALAIFGIYLAEMQGEVSTGLAVGISVLIFIGCALIVRHGIKLLIDKRNPAGFFLLFAILWFLIALGSNFCFGYQPFSLFLTHAPALKGLRAVGRLFVFTNLGLAIFAAFAWQWLRETSLSQKPRWVFAVTFLTCAELLGGSIWTIQEHSYDPIAVKTTLETAGVRDFYKELSNKFREGAIFEFPTSSHGDILRFYQYGSALRDNLHRVQGLTGYTPGFFVKTIDLLGMDERSIMRGESESNNSRDVETLLENLPVHAIVVHLGGIDSNGRPAAVSSNVLKILKESTVFRETTTLTISESESYTVYERKIGIENEQTRIGFVPHPVLIHGLRDLSSISMAAPTDFNPVVSLPIRANQPTKFQLVWPYLKFMPHAKALVLELAPGAPPVSIELSWGGHHWKSTDVANGDGSVRRVAFQIQDFRPGIDENEILKFTIRTSYREIGGEAPPLPISGLYLSLQVPEDSVTVAR